MAITEKIFLIENQKSPLGGYQVFRKNNEELQFVCDLNFLNPIETYDEVNESLSFNYYTPLINALEYVNIEYELDGGKEQCKFTINEKDLNELFNHLYQSEINKLRSISKKNRGKASEYLMVAQNAEARILEIKPQSV